MTDRPLVIPIDLGGSPHRWLLQPKPRKPPAPALVAAMVEHYLTERHTRPGQPVEVAFFHGGMPSRDQLDAAGAYAKRLACLPGDLVPEALDRMVHAGVQTIELDVGTVDTRVRRSLSRRMSQSNLARLVCGLGDRGIRVGVVLSPGLPGASHAMALEDAQWVVRQETVQFVRLLPAIAWRETPGAELVTSGRWTPMNIGQAVTTLESMVDLLEDGGVEVARIGLQPGPDLRAKVAAGPTHPNLRSLVEARRFRRKMRAALSWMPRSRGVLLRVHPADLGWAKGVANANVRALRSELGLPDLAVRPDSTVPRGQVRPADGRDMASPEPETLSTDKMNGNQNE